ncbi:MAG TPA: tetratricopeptide repeat protein [Phycisphaerales bacterium]|nr:tetratricopeptide repeat protein [Phycisphaerales bacterium]
MAIRNLVASMLVVAALLGGCSSSKPGSPYAGVSEAERNPTEADRLNQEAVAVIDSDPAKAEDLLRRALGADLYHAPAHNNLGTLLLQRGKLYEAAGEFEWAKKLMPGHPDPRMNLALTLEVAGRTEEAIDTYRTALEVYPEHIATMQALTRIQVRTGRSDAETKKMLAEIALRGETEEWRKWAQGRLATSAKP